MDHCVRGSGGRVHINSGNFAVEHAPWLPHVSLTSKWCDNAITFLVMRCSLVLRSAVPSERKLSVYPYLCQNCKLFGWCCILKLFRILHRDRPIFELLNFARQEFLSAFLQVYQVCTTCDTVVYTLITFNISCYGVDSAGHRSKHKSSLDKV